MDITRLVRPAVRRLKAYEAREVPARVKLDANESPYGFALRSPLPATNRYPDPEARELRKRAAREFGIRRENVLVGNGSDELIYYLVTTFGGPVLYPTPTFVMYGAIARALGEETVEVPLSEDFDLDETAMRRAVRERKPRLSFLSTPNNPTGNCFSAGRVLSLIERAPGMVVVDEAYQPFSSERGFLPLLRDYSNLLILRTLSKVGLAALRVGFLVGSAEALEQVNKVRLPFNLSAPSQALAVEALGEKRARRAAIRSIVRERGRLMRELRRVPGVTAYPSEANFILFRVPGAGRVHKGLLKRGVLVRNMEGALPGCLRVTVGAPEENGAFLDALKETLR
jgi:histidinol-phosphate aminotransferase